MAWEHTKGLYIRNPCRIVDFSKKKKERKIVLFLLCDQILCNIDTKIDEYVLGHDIILYLLACKLSLHPFHWYGSYLEMHFSIQSIFDGTYTFFLFKMYTKNNNTFIITHFRRIYIEYIDYRRWTVMLQSHLLPSQYLFLTIIIIFIPKFLLPCNYTIQTRLEFMRLVTRYAYMTSFYDNS